MTYLVDQGGGIYYERHRSSTSSSTGIGSFNGAPMNRSTAAAAIFSNDSGIEIIEVDTSANAVADVAYRTGHKTIWVATGDFNNDGIVDAVTANYDNNSVTCILMPAAQ